MITIPQGVSSCLYNGIMNKIEWIQKQIEYDVNKKYELKNHLERIYKDVVEAVDFYNEHCILSGKYLKDALDELTLKYNEYLG
ncbi:hypothetical protein [Paenibacillus naphthalenovorans]|uniref:Uncharacterized protein n=1 Tax=Paenibacillus naphthalenovorans TaxID=162209 RepID=A0A0U2IM86_9BACL|nr:hypothetical protein [Paenibacillus naphthalenovorans]ALS22235.1 hypothetical protein IJ22_18610 [Paenibacillus naphthalenovorans]